MIDQTQQTAATPTGAASRAEGANLTAVLAVTADELRTICDTAVRLTQIRQLGCPHLCVENFAPEMMRKLLLELQMHKQGLVRAEDLGALGGD